LKSGNAAKQGIPLESRDVNNTKLAVALVFSGDGSESLLGPGNIASESFRREGVEFIWTDRL
jgi:hypothetical protein